VKLGDKLKREREARGVSLQEISASTRVNIKFLQALERDDYSEYQAPVFVTGFLRSYANHLGLDADRIIAEYESLNVELRNEATLVKKIEDEEKPFPIGLIAGGVAVILLLFGFVSLFTGGSKPQPRQPDVMEKKAEPNLDFEIVEGDSLTEPAPPEGKKSEKQVKKEKSKPATGSETAPVKKKKAKKVDKGALGGSEKTGEPQAAAVPPKDAPVPEVLDVGGVPDGAGERAKYVLRVTAIDQEVWVLVVIDDDIVRDMFVRPQQTVVLKGNESFLFTTGRASSIRMTLNGESIPIEAPESNVIRNWSLPLPE
jgi:cytoskeleton protein RodZ